MSLIRRFYFLSLLQRNQWLDKELIEDLQIRKLKNIIRHAYNSTPFYHDKLRKAQIHPDDIRTLKDIQRIPITTKEEVRRFGLKTMISKNVQIRKCRIARTSGSTGIPLKIAYDSIANDYSKAVNMRSLVENGLRISDKWINFGDRRNVEKRSVIQHLGFFNMINIGVLEDFNHQISKILEIQPDVIYGYPSNIGEIGRYLKSKAIPFKRPRLIFTTAELLTPEKRDLIKSTFNVNPIDLFGCVEMNRTAWECDRHEGYHIDADSVLIEFLDDEYYSVSPGERGRIVYTCLFNKAMPFIRYDIGDIGIPSDEKCSCGRNLPIMTRLEGRNDDLIILPNNNTIGPVGISLLMREIDGIIEYQFVQESIDKIRIFIVVEENFNKNSLQDLSNKVQQSLDKEMEIDLVICERIPKDRSGKLRSVISRINKP